MRNQPLGPTWVEIIRVRLADTANADKVRGLLEEQVSRCSALAPLPAHAELYCNTRVSTDWAIHLVWVGEEGDPEKSSLGTSLYLSLRELGIVNHSSWKED